MKKKIYGYKICDNQDQNKPNENKEHRNVWLEDIRPREQRNMHLEDNQQRELQATTRIKTCQRIK